MNFASQGGGHKRAEHVARAIEDRIVELGWPVGQLIGSEQSLMAEHDASRGVLREAVRLLEHHGTARMRRGPGGGLVVEQPSAHAVRRSASLLLQYKRVDPAGLVAARKALELTCLDMVAMRSTTGGQPLELAQLESGEAAESADFGVGFHTALAGLAGNPPLALFASTLIEMHGEAVDGTPGDPELLLLDADDCLRDHAAIQDAVVCGDWTRARGHLEEHLERLVAVTLATADRDESIA